MCLLRIFIAIAVCVATPLISCSSELVQWISPADFSGSQPVVTFEALVTHGQDFRTPEGVYIHTEQGTSGLGFSYRTVPGRTGPAEPTALGNFYALDFDTGYASFFIDFPELVTRVGMDIDRLGQRRIEFTLL